MLTLQQIANRQEALATEMMDLARALRTAAAMTQRVTAVAERPTLASSLVGTRWSDRVARGSVGVLFGQNGKPLTYTELHEALVKAGAPPNIGSVVKYAGPLGRVCEAFASLGKLNGRPVPVLTSLVVGARHHKGLPGPGLNPHLQDWLSAIGRDDLAAMLTPRETAPREIVEIAQEAVIAFPDWPAALVAIGLTGDPTTDMARAM